jgi:hypothetical protein
MRQKKTPVHFLCCNAALTSLAMMSIQVDQLAFQSVLMTGADESDSKPCEMRNAIVALSESLGGSHIDLEDVVNKWDAIKELYYSGISPDSDGEPRTMDLCIGAAEEAMQALLTFMER